MISLLLASLLIADVPEGFQVPSRPIIQNETTGSCANMDVGANRFDIGDGICVYENPGHGWFYIKNGTAHGSTCTLTKEWCAGFPSKDAAISASKGGN